MRVIAPKDHQMRRQLENDIYLASCDSCDEICANTDLKLPLCCCRCCSLVAVVLLLHPIRSINESTDCPFVLWLPWLEMKGQWRSGGLPSENFFLNMPFI